jgi:DNA-binding response OmpR family regulator
MMLNTTRILVIDDDSHIRALLVAILSADGYAVFAAVTGADGLRQATAATPATWSSSTFRCRT